MHGDEVEFGVTSVKECGMQFKAVLQKYNFMARPREFVRLTGNITAAENYMRRFDQEMEVVFHCIYKEKAGVQCKSTIKIYNHLVLAFLGHF